MLGECWWFLIDDLKDGVIFYIIDHIGRWSGRYHESLMKIRHDLADWLHFGFRGGWGFLTGDLEDRVIFDIINQDDQEDILKVSWRSDMIYIWIKFGTWRTWRFVLSTWNICFQFYHFLLCQVQWILECESSLWCSVQKK